MSASGSEVLGFIPSAGGLHGAHRAQESPNKVIYTCTAIRPDKRNDPMAR
jgi:hypothetical protein